MAGKCRECGEMRALSSKFYMCAKCTTNVDFKNVSIADYWFLLDWAKEGKAEYYYSALNRSLTAALKLIFGLEPDRLSCSDIKDELAYKRGDYAYIPLPPADFVVAISAALLTKPRAKKFIDVGSGIGDKAFLASDYFNLTAYGIEYTPDSYYAGKFLSKKFMDLYPNKPRPTFILGDAFEHDFKPYDIIYMYQPISREMNMLNLYKHIYRTAKVGAVIVETLPMYAWSAFRDWLKLPMENRKSYAILVKPRRKYPND